MLNHNRLAPGPLFKTGLAASISAAALAGCGSSNNAESIPKCPETPGVQTIVTNEDSVIAAYEDAGQRLADAYKTAPKGPRRQRLAIAFTQLFNTSNKNTGLFHDITPQNQGGAVSKDAYLADDPAELMCRTQNAGGQPELDLSVEAIKARIILRDAGTPVHGLSSYTARKD